MNRLLYTPLALFFGCNPSPQPVAPEVTVAAAPQPEPAPKAQPVVQAPPKKEEPPAPPTMFPFPNDAAGKELPRVVTPPAPPSLPVEKLGLAPKVRLAPAKVLDPAPLPKMTYAPSPLPAGKPASILPTAPLERVPLDLGFGASAVPAKPTFPESPGIAIKARDVNLPPDLVPLGRQLADRASLEDPTAEPGNSTIVTRTPTPVLGQSGFLKVVLPDPFELGDQVKSKVLPAAEPSPAPVVVNPQRVK